jgi:DNA-binding MarR family transcriptional regulator
MSSIMRKSIDLVNHTAASAASAGAADPAGDDVLEAIHAVMHLVRSQQYRTAGAGPQDLTHMDGKVLGFFARHPGATQSELAAHSGRDKGQLARLIGGLRERGLLEAQADESDRRNLRLTLTAAGRAVQQTLQRRRRRLSDLAVAGMSDAEQRELLDLLARVQANRTGEA